MKGIDVARTQLGVKELTGHNDGIPATRYNRGDQLPWCASFCLYCNACSTDTKVARSTKEYYALRVVDAFEAEMKLRGWWLAPEAVPQSNDFIFFADRGQSDPARTGKHMGIVHQVMLEGPDNIKVLYLSSIEGNWSNEVQEVLHNLQAPSERARVTGYARLPENLLNSPVSGK